MTDSNDRPMLEASLESAEVVADALLDDQILKDIPVVGLAVKLCKAADSIRNRLFAAKLERFVYGLGEDHEALASKYRQKMAESADEARLLGETLLMVLERITDVEKAEVIAALFRAYVDNVITSEDLRRMVQSVDLAFMDDLRKLLAVRGHPEKSTEPWLRYLAPSGLSITVGGKTFGDVGAVYYEVSALGGQFQNAYFHGCR